MLETGTSRNHTEHRVRVSDNTNELRMLTGISAGNRRTFEVFYRLYFPRLTRFLDRILRNTVLIEEIINDTMWTVWRRADSFDHSCKVSTWIFAIAYRKALKALKTWDAPIDADPDLYAGEACLQPEAVLDRHELSQLVGDALDAIPLEQRIVVNLAYYHDMHYEEIAEIMDCPVNTVKSRMLHARRRLKALLAGQLEPGS